MSVLAYVNMASLVGMIGVSIFIGVGMVFSFLRGRGEEEEPLNPEESIERDDLAVQRTETPKRQDVPFPILTLREITERQKMSPNTSFIDEHPEEKPEPQKPPITLEDMIARKVELKEEANINIKLTLSSEDNKIKALGKTWDGVATIEIKPPEKPVQPQWEEESHEVEG